MMNIYSGQIDVVTSPYFDELVDRSLAVVPWLLFSTTPSKSLFAHATVNGQTGVRVEHDRMGISRFGFCWRFSAQYGFAPKNFQQGIFSTGAAAPLSVMSVDEAVSVASAPKVKTPKA